MMIITEQDIFNYVFFRDNLSEEKREYIEKEKIFTDEINFYNELKTSIIPDKKEYILTPAAISKTNRQTNSLRLAAASVDLTHKNEFITFSDGTSNYLCRLIKIEEKLLLYVISGDEKAGKKLKVTLYPSKDVFIIDNLLFPLELPPGLQIDQINLEEI